MTSSIPKFIRRISAILICIGFSLLLVNSRWASTIDSHVYDRLLNALPSSSSSNSEISIAAIDNESLDTIKDPLVLWTGHFATIVDALSIAGARAVIFDVIPAISLDGFAPEVDIRFMEAIKNAKRRGTEVYLGFKNGETGDVMPHPKFMFLASGINFLNLSPDADGKIRRQPLWFKDEKGRIAPSIGLAAAMAYSGDSGSPEEFACGRLKLCDETNDVPSVYVDYRLVEKRIKMHSICALLTAAPEKVRGDFHGKVVLIGSTSARLPDNHATPVSGGDYTPGVIVHAGTTLSLLSVLRLRETGDWFRIYGTVVLALISSISIMTLSPARAASLLLILFLFAAAAIVKSFSGYLVLPASPILFGIIIPSVISGSYLYAGEHRRYHRLQRYFKSYVHPDVMKEIIDHPERVSFDGGLVKASIMFADIRNFTTLSERLRPTEVVKGLNYYLSEMSKVIISEGGYVNRFLGDGILAIFGAPNELPEDGRLAAVKGGLAMLRRLEEINKLEIFPGVERLEIGIGIHTGEAIVGNIGSLDKMDFSIIGDAANLASRVEGLTKSYATPFLITGSTYEPVSDRVEAEYIDCVKVKGREGDVKIYRVIGLKKQ